MQIIVITTEALFDGEEQLIGLIAAEGADRIHLRKPSASREEFERLIRRIPTELYARLSLHDHHELAVKYGLGGVHLNERNPLPPAGLNGLISRSCHSIEELRTHNTADYLFLSPIYDSISKAGYAAAFSPEVLREARPLLTRRVIALGGVEPDKLAELRRYGFVGAALLGYVWGDRSRETVRARMAEIRKQNK